MKQDYFSPTGKYKPQAQLQFEPITEEEADRQVEPHPPHIIVLGGRHRPLVDPEFGGRHSPEGGPFQPPQQKVVRAAPLQPGALGTRQLPPRVLETHLPYTSGFFASHHFRFPAIESDLNELEAIT